MITQQLVARTPVLEQDFTGELHEEYLIQKALFQAQPLVVKRKLELQARLVAKAIDERSSPVHFELPEQVACEVDGGSGKTLLTVPPDMREQKVGGLMEVLRVSDLDQRLSELEASADRAVSTCAGLMRYAIASYMVHVMLPDGRKTIELSYEGYVKRFFLPQWVAFDDQDNLLVNSIAEAKAGIAALQHCVAVLRTADSLTPYIVSDKEYRRKLNGVIGQLINQGRALARYETGEIVRIIWRRAAINNLNRGVSLSLPYFDDQTLETKTYDFEVIPAGRINFEPVYLVWAARYEQNRLVHDMRITPSTRKHLLAELRMLEKAFDKSTES